MLKYEIREICGDWAIYEVRPDAEGEYTESEPVLILNSRANAEYVKAILEHELRYPNAAVPYRPEVAQMSDEECVAVNRLCCSGGHQCHACPLSGSESVEETCFEVDRRVNGLAERYLEWRKEDVVRCKDCEFAIEEDENLYTCEVYVGGYNSGQTFCSYGKRREGGAERYVEAARSPSPADGGSSLPEGASGADADDTNVGRKSEWISVDERLPSADEIRDEYGELVPFLVVEKDTTQPFRAFYDGFVWGDGFVKLDVTHWMPLPEPPR